MAELENVVRDGLLDLDLGVANPRSIGVSGGDGAIGKATDGTRWIKVGAGDTDWEQILISTNGVFLFGFGDLTPTYGYVIRGDGTEWVAATNFRVDAGIFGSGTEMGSGVANGIVAVAEGAASAASGIAAHAEGASTVASGDYSHAEGSNTDASSNFSHAEGSSTDASGIAAHAEGASTVASGDYSHAEGAGTVASGNYSHAEGISTEASGDYSAATGRRAKAIHNGARVESDSQNADVSSTTTDQYTARFQNGYEFKGGAANFEDADGTRTNLGLLSASATLDFGSIAAQDSAELTITVTGAATGDAVQLAPPSGIEADLAWCGYVSAADTVTVRLVNATSGAIDPASATWGAIVTPLS